MAIPAILAGLINTVPGLINTFGNLIKDKKKAIESDKLIKK